MTASYLYAGSAYSPNVKPRVPLDGAVTSGAVRALKSTLELANGLGSGTLISFGKVPSNGIPHRKSDLYNDAMTSLTSVSLGVGRLAITSADVFTLTDGSATCLVNAADVHTGGVLNMTAFDFADIGKPFWQIAGYSDDPGGELDVVGTIGATLTTGSGTVTIDLLYDTVG